MNKKSKFLISGNDRRLLKKERGGLVKLKKTFYFDVKGLSYEDRLTIQEKHQQEIDKINKLLESKIK